MAFDIGPKIGIDGEAEFRQAIQGINTTMKTLGSEMAVVTSEFGKNERSAESLTARNEVLTKQIDTQRDKLSMLSDGLAAATAKYGENDTKTQQWQQQVNKATAELNNMERELKTNTNELNNNSETVENAGSKWEGFSEKLATAARATSVVVAAAMAATVAFAKSVVQQFGELEQNLGGSEAVFGEYAASIQKTGEEAYKNLGVSQSDYLATANKMGALFQGSGVEQQKSLELTTQAMQRAADMASVMGIDMQVALDSVAGAAKGNFTMMDNLGVAMNATSIQAYAVANGLDFVWSTASQAEKAEVAMQMFFESTEQYAGNFAKESTQTVSGSIGLLQAALGSFTAGLGNADADMQNLAGNLVDAFQSVVSNVVPVLQNIVTALPSVMQGILSAVGELLPLLIETGTSLFDEVLSTIIGLLPTLTPVIVSALLLITQAVVDNLPMLVDAAVQMVIALAQGIASALPTLVPQVVSVITSIVQTIIANLPMLLTASLSIITGLADGILAALPVLIEALLEIIKGIVDFVVGAIPQIIETGIALITALVDALPEIIDTIVEVLPEIIDAIITALIDNVPLIMQAGIELITALVKALPTIITTIVDALPTLINSIITAMLDNIDLFVKMYVDLFLSLVKALPEIIWGVLAAVTSIIVSILAMFRDNFKNFVEIGKDLIRGLWEGIKEMGAWIGEKVKGFMNGIVGGIRDVLDMHSPSRVLVGIGKNMALSLGGGFVDNMDDVVRDINDSIPTSFDMPTINAQADIAQNDRAAAMVNAFGSLANGMQAQGGGDLTISVVLQNGVEVARAFLSDFRNASNQSPEIVGI